MAKAIMQNPTIKGRAAKKFSEMFLSKDTLSSKKAEQNKKDLELYRSAIKIK